MMVALLMSTSTDTSLVSLQTPLLDSTDCLDSFSLHTKFLSQTHFLLLNLQSDGEEDM